MPRKFEIEQERDELRAKLEEAHAILGEALGYDEDERINDEVETSDDDEGE